MSRGTRLLRINASPFLTTILIWDSASGSSPRCSRVISNAQEDVSGLEHRDMEHVIITESDPLVILFTAGNNQ